MGDHSKERESKSSSGIGKPIMLQGISIEQLGMKANLQRELYNKGTEAILKEAYKMLDSGRSDDVVARWVVKQRNILKVEIRTKGPALFRKVAEWRNKGKYNNPVGPSFEQLKTKGLSNQKIITGVKNTSKGFNAAGGALKIGGTLLGGVGFIFQATQPTPVSLGPLPNSQKKEVEIERTRLKYKIPASANIDVHGHLKPGFYMQLEPFDIPHGGDEFVAETEEILWFLGVDITYEYRNVTWTVPGKSWD